MSLDLGCIECTMMEVEKENFLQFLTVLSPRLLTMHDSTTVCPGITSIELGTLPNDGNNFSS